MASPSSIAPWPDRRQARRRQTIEEALDAAVAIMEEAGVGGLSMSEIARRLGMRQPSLYKYFGSLHAVYDALFARGLERSGAAVQAAVEAGPRGVETLRAVARAVVRWAVENPALAQLLYWRPVPGFAPAAATFAVSARQMDEMRAGFAEAARAGLLHPDAASDEAQRLFTVVLSGIISQQLANQPGAGYEAGMFTSLTDAALDMFFARYTPQEEPMQTLDNDQVSVHIGAPPQVVYALVADVTRTPEFSPEIVRCTWLDGAAGPAAGARFEAVNKLSRGPAWTNRPVVTAARPGREFAFSRTEKLSGTLIWRYQLEPDGTGTRLTESYQVTRPVSRLGWFIIGRLYGGRDRRAELRAGMEQTVQRIRETAERGTRSGHAPPDTAATPGGRARSRPGQAAAPEHVR